MDGLGTAPGKGHEPNEMLGAISGACPDTTELTPVVIGSDVTTEEDGLVIESGAMIRVDPAGLVDSEVAVEPVDGTIEAGPDAVTVGQETVGGAAAGEGGSSKLTGEHGGDGVGLVPVDISQLVASL